MSINTFPTRMYVDVKDLESIDKNDLLKIVNTSRKIYERDVKIRQKQQEKQKIMKELMTNNVEFKKLVDEKMNKTVVKIDETDENEVETDE